MVGLLPTHHQPHRPGFPQVPNLRHSPSLPKLQRGPASTRGPEQGVEQQRPSTVSVPADSLPSCSCISRPQKRNSHRGCPEVGGACPTVKVNSMWLGQLRLPLSPACPVHTQPAAHKVLLLAALSTLAPRLPPPSPHLLSRTHYSTPQQGGLPGLGGPPRSCAPHQSHCSVYSSHHCPHHGWRILGGPPCVQSPAKALTSVSRLNCQMTEEQFSEAPRGSVLCLVLAVILTPTL